MYIKIVTVFLVLLSYLFSNTLTRTQVIMGTLVHITLEEGHNREISASFQALRQLESSLSSYAPYLVNRLNHTHTIPFDPALARAMKLSKQYYQDTHGYFDITIGSISKSLYHFGEEKTYSPSTKALKSATHNIEGIHITPKSISTDKNIVIDLGGIGKGLAVDNLVAYLKEQNISKGIIALSGDIQCLHHCDLFLQSPFNEGTFAHIQSHINNLSISTSGTYRRYATKKSEHHLIDPKTASQGKAFVSVSLFTHANNSKIDAYATAVSVMPKEKALAFLKNHKEIGYVLVEPDGNVIFGNVEKFMKVVWEKNRP